eukprot:7888125-Pyramimonas_sp.AAC.1
MPCVSRATSAARRPQVSGDNAAPCGVTMKTKKRPRNFSTKNLRSEACSGIRKNASLKSKPASSVS